MTCTSSLDMASYGPIHEIKILAGSQNAVGESGKKLKDVLGPETFLRSKEWKLTPRNFSQEQLELL